MSAALGSLRGIITGLALVGGGFLLIFAIGALVAAVSRTYDQHIVETRWIETAATIEKCELFVYTPRSLLSQDKGRFFDEYSLRCRLRYEFSQHRYAFNLRTLPDTSLEARTSIAKWVEVHRAGAILGVRVNPSNPKEIAVASQLPLPQSGTPRQAWRMAMYCGAGSALLFAIFRIIRPATPSSA